MLTRTLILKASGLSPIQKIVRSSRLFKPIVSRFIAGDDLETALGASKKLLDKKIRITLDYLGENTSSEEEAKQAVKVYCEMLNRINVFPEADRKLGAPSALIPINTKDIPEKLKPPEPLNISIKLTQCGLDQGIDFCEKNLLEVLWIAEESGNFVRIDMESSAHTEATLKMLEMAWQEYKNVGTVLQSYLHRNDEDVERIIEMGARCRLVKGAYLEPPDIAYSDKLKVDEAFVRQAKRLLVGGFYPAIATQDEAIINELKKFISGKQIDPSRFEFQMLYGIRRDLQESLTAEGFNVRVYVPFGDSWYPYFTRRLAERPANVAFIVKSFLKG